MVGLQEVDRRRANAVRIYLARRLPMAEKNLPAPLLAGFRSFCRLWGRRFDWSDPALLASYIVLPRLERDGLYQRFARECRSWEATLRLSNGHRPAETVAAPPKNGPTATRFHRNPEEQEARRRRIREMEEREERARKFYERLAQEASAQARTFRMPWGIREAYHTLGLPPGAPLEDVRKTFRKLALKHHPDRQGDHATMSQLNQAYREILQHLGSS